MKKILFYLNIAGAIFFLNSLCAQDVKPELGFGIALQECAFDACSLNSDNLFFDACLEDISDEDSTDSEREKLSSGKTSYFNTSFVAQNFSYYFYKIFPTKLSFPRKASLLIFICTFRI